MKRYRQIRKYGLGVALVVPASNAFAAFTATTEQNAWTTLLGTSTTGSETGIYEYGALIVLAIPLALALTVLFRGGRIMRRVIGMFK